jgi:SAM-dependent methyltransferase
MFAFRPFADVPASEWDALVESSPDGWVWALSRWQKLILDVQEWGLADFSFGAYAGSRLVGVMPLQYQAASQKMASSGWGLVGPVISGAHGSQERTPLLRAMLAHAEELAREQKATRVELGASPLTASSRNARWGVNPFVPFGYEDISTHTKIVALELGIESIWSSISENAKRKIKLATKLGVTVQRVDWLSMLDRYYEAHCTTYRRTGVTPHPRTYFEAIARELAPRGHAVLWAAFTRAGEPIAFRNDARCRDGVVYHTGCSKNEALETGANYLLVWEAVQGAVRDGFRWYEIGEVFPAAKDGKARGLTEYKSRFGGDLHRYFKAFKILDPADPMTVPDSATTLAQSTADSERTVRDAYQKGTVYAPARICARVNSGTDDYADRLLQDRFGLVAENYGKGRLVDLCCASGAHLIDLAKEADRAIGIDFTARYLETAAQHAAAEGRQNVSFVQADARSIPLNSGSVDCLYCFSSLYAIPRAEEVVAEVGRVLAPGGRAILDFGNRRSLNAFCVKYYTEWPPIHPLTLGEIRRAIARAGLAIVRHRRFQLLPLWAGRPAWLWPLLHPGWKKVFRTRVFGKMADEWVSSLPGLRAFAFRHVIVCRKSGAQA